MMDSVVIRISSDTRELLKQRATKDQTYDQVIREMAEVYDALMGELERMLYAPKEEWVEYGKALRELGLTEKEIESERETLDQAP